jgi:hypothetical protein
MSSRNPVPSIFILSPFANAIGNLLPDVFKADFEIGFVQWCSPQFLPSFATLSIIRSTHSWRRVPLLQRRKFLRWLRKSIQYGIYSVRSPYTVYRTRCNSAKQASTDHLHGAFHRKGWHLKRSSWIDPIGRILH